MDPAPFDRFDPDRCLNRIMLDESGKPAQCVRDLYERPCLYVLPLLEPEERARQRRLAGGDE